MADEPDPLMQMRVTRKAEVAISLEDMYRLLIKIDSGLSNLALTVQNAGVIQKDHEQRIRDLEQQRLSETRVTAMEDDVKAIRAELEAMKSKVYAIPGASVVIAAAALVFTLIRMF